MSFNFSRRSRDRMTGVHPARCSPIAVDMPAMPSPTTNARLPLVFCIVLLSRD